ncbi:MAG: sugar phosphate isomerase/epimerase family protein, partial [Rubrobacter sp.]
MTALSKDGGPAFGAHAFIWAGEWTREGAERVISGAAQAGLDFVEIPLLDPGSIDVEHTRSLLDRYGLGCSCSLGLPPDVHLPSNPEGARRFLDGAVEATAALGSPVLTGCLYTHVG